VDPLQLPLRVVKSLLVGPLRVVKSLLVDPLRVVKSLLQVVKSLLEGPLRVVKRLLEAIQGPAHAAPAIPPTSPCGPAAFLNQKIYTPKSKKDQFLHPNMSVIKSMMR
jgi:hypothetical protein